MAKGKYEYWISKDGLLCLEAWARDGLTDEQIASNMGIVPSTLYDWKKKYPEISESMKRGKTVVDIEVENALLKRALGYQYTEVRTKDGKDGVEVTTTVKEMAPDTAAANIWLKNRKPFIWGGKTANRLEGSSDQPEGVRGIILTAVQLLGKGEIDHQTASTIISGCNALLSSIRSDEQEKKIEELSDMLEEMMKLHEKD